MATPTNTQALQLMDSTQQLYISKAYDFKYFAYIYIFNHPFTVVAGVAQLVCRPDDRIPRLLPYRRSSAVLRSIYNFATFAVPHTAGCESILWLAGVFLAEVRWTWMRLSAVKVNAVIRG